MTRARAGLVLTAVMPAIMYAGCTQNITAIGTAGPEGASCSYTSDIQVSEELARIIADTVGGIVNPTSGIFSARTADGETIVIGYRVTLGADLACTAEYWPIEGAS